MENSTVNLGTLTIGLLSNLDIYLFSINPLFGLPTYSYVLWLIVKGTKSGVASEFFYLNLTVCEIVYSLGDVFTLLSGFFSSFTTMRFFFQGLGITGRPLFQCLMCVERYLAVVHPVTFLKYKPLRYRLICCAVVWIITLGSCLCCIVAADLSKYYIYIHFYSIQFLFFFPLQLFCLVAVLRALKQSGPGEGKREKEENHMKRRAFHLILAIAVSTIIIYVPYTVIGLFFMVTQLFIRELFSFCLICFVLAGFVQPVLYLHRAGKLACLCLS